jgi:hypothetical protein
MEEGLNTRTPMQDWNGYMSHISEADLLDYVSNYTGYETVAVEAAIRELANRGKPLQSAKIIAIRTHLSDLDREAREKEDERNYTESLLSGELDNKATLDPSAPLFYSQQAIFLFSLLFSPLFGAFMLCANIERTPARKGFFVAAAFGILYPVGESLLLRELGTRNLMLVTILNAIGAWMINGVLWPQFIGVSKVYQKRSPVYPVIFGGIVVLIMLVLLFLDFTDRKTSVF